MRIGALACLLLVACGGGGGATTPAKPDGSCEPGRCLPDIAKAIAPHRPAARACYEQGLKRAPEIKDGRIVINFDIDPSGATKDVAASMKSGQIEDPEVVACVVDVVKGIAFPKSAAGKTTRAYHAFEFGMHPKDN